jgi:FkbM family methyltransferase
MNDNVRESVANSPNCGGIFEQLVIGLYKAILKPKSNAIDGGANTGWHTFQMAECVPEGRVFAFEPLPVLAQILSSRKGRFGERVILGQKAVSNFEGKAQFNYFNGANPKYPNDPYWNAGLSGLRSSGELLKTPHEVIEVDVIRLDSYLELHTPNALDFIKLDIEGGEYQALLGAQKTIGQHRPTIAFEDGGPGVGRVYGYNPNEFPALFASWEYDLYDILGQKYWDGEWVNRQTWRPWYSVAIPRELPVATIMTPIEGVLSKLGLLR